MFGIKAFSASYIILLLKLRSLFPSAQLPTTYAMLFPVFNTQDLMFLRNIVLLSANNRTHAEVSSIERNPRKDQYREVMSNDARYSPAQPRACRCAKRSARCRLLQTVAKGIRRTFFSLSCSKTRINSHTANEPAKKGG